ncbi:Serine-type D-Ala-D-Ala carboxypeptidase [Arthrobacter sp. FB24]|uniref:serine hydrolase domain-containing protein n=1 Tax=Arthrobacter sp. (strain FB24) TaxID=290399 RepID=UPI0000527260|nr:serine hydrolase domain-containing protein [Arthrobacter sp. FB24]ABK04026.1 Serine-type D-Ala-D-Ala carboxypeptidase [Arthrobacter sp. FB24]
MKAPGFPKNSPAALAVALMLAVAGCSVGPAPGPPASSPAPSDTPPSATGSGTTDVTPPASSGGALQPFDQAALEQTFKETARELRVPGAVMLLRTPGGTATYTYGVRSVGGDDPVTPADHVRIGSITKTWTTTVILQLVQEKKIKLDDPVAAYRPDVPDGANITIEQLLTMRSGLYNYTEDLEVNKVLDTDPGKVWTTDELLAAAFRHPPYFAPGEGFHYSNTNTVLLGLIAEALDGKPLSSAFRDRLFTPLGLSGSVFPDQASNAIPEPHPQGYMYGNNVLTLDDPALPEDMQKAAAEGTLKPVDQTAMNASWAWSAGSGISTAADLATWAEALGGGKVLGPELQKLRLDSPRPVKADDPGGALYGLGIAKFGQLFGHTGELPGFNSFAGHDPANKVTLVVWTNLAPTPDGRDPVTTIARTLIGKVYQ